MSVGTLVESVRTARGPRQRIVATIGKLPGLEEMGSPHDQIQETLHLLRTFLKLDPRVINLRAKAMGIKPRENGR